MNNKQSTLIGHKRRRKCHENKHSQPKRLKTYTTTTPFSDLDNFEPNILNIVSDFTTPKLVNTHHHWWVYHGLSDNMDLAIQTCIRCNDIQVFAQLVQRPKFVNAKQLQFDAVEHITDYEVDFFSYFKHLKHIFNSIDELQDHIVNNQLDVNVMFYLYTKHGVKPNDDINQVFYDQGYFEDLCYKCRNCLKTFDSIFVRHNETYCQDCF